MTQLYTVTADSLAGRLILAAGDDWPAYTHHAFVEGLRQGDLPPAAFRHYLVQDYRFLVHFSRAWALAAFKTDDIAEIRACTATVHALINDEIDLHVRTCAGFGLSEADLQAAPEAPANTAYTRYVLERGLAGDLLDLLVALSPCVIGYGEIGARLLAATEGKRDGHPYADWITTYGGADYQAVNQAAAAQLARVAANRLGEAPWETPRWTSLVATFRQATVLEVGFWDMGLEGAV